MKNFSETDPEARPTAPDTPPQAGQKQDTQLSDAALDKVAGGATNFNSSKSNVY